MNTLSVALLHPPLFPSRFNHVVVATVLHTHVLEANKSCQYCLSLFSDTSILTALHSHHGASRHLSLPSILSDTLTGYPHIIPHIIPLAFPAHDVLQYRGY